MKHIRTYEEIDFSKLKEGDPIYCINNKGVDLEIGKEYIVKQVWPDRKQFRLTDDSKWMGFRFSQDPHHPEILKSNANKYNL